MKLQVARGLMLLLALGTLVDSVSVNTVWAQNQTGRRNRGTAADKAPAVKLPDDPRLLELHRALVRDAEKLAIEYQKSKQLDKARVIYGEIIRFVPTYGKAATALQTIRGTEATAERKVFEVSANKGWQDTNIDVVEGRPTLFRVFEGKWHLLMDYPVGADGIEIPKELRQFNLGALIGIIVPAGESPSHHEAPPSAENAPAAQPAEAVAADKDSTASTDSNPPASSSGDPSSEEKAKEQDKGPKPFLVGSKLDLLAPSSGRLYLRMYDAQPDDNSGKLKVTITGTFGPPPAYSGSKESSTLGQQ